MSPPSFWHTPGHSEKKKALTWCKPCPAISKSQLVTNTAPELLHGGCSAGNSLCPSQSQQNSSHLVFTSLLFAAGWNKSLTDILSSSHQCYYMEGFHLPLFWVVQYCLVSVLCHESLLFIPEPVAASEPAQLCATVWILLVLCCLAGAECGECLWFFRIKALFEVTWIFFWLCLFIISFKMTVFVGKIV